MANIIIAIITIIPTIATLIVSSVTNSKVKKQEDIINRINNLDKKLGERIDLLEFDDLQRYIISQTSKIEKGYIADEEEKKMLLKAYDRYHNPKSEGGLGGDTFVESKVERLISEGLL